MMQLETAHDSEAYFPFGFPVSKKAWEAFRVSALFEAGTAVTPVQILRAIRQLAYMMNHHDGIPAPKPIRAGQLLAIAFLNDVWRYLINRFCFEHQPKSLEMALEQARTHLAPTVPEDLCGAFIAYFPPYDVCVGRTEAKRYLQGTTHDVEHSVIVAREMLLLALDMENPALQSYRSLFDDRELAQQVPYRALVKDIEQFLGTQPTFPPPFDKPLFELLREPMLACPDSLEGQLDYIRTHWTGLLPADFLERLMLTVGVLGEETRLRGLGPGSVEVLEFGRSRGLALDYPEPARFSRDRDWMANVVLIAKNAHVWLDQLSRNYQRSITRLDQIPDAELDRLAQWGFTGLWLIGLWERSHASEKIKKIMGNPEAAASAYSLYDYVIAADLGGEEAQENLRERAAQRGIRLASDMVPNHVGIYSKWVIEHPDWFIQADVPPFPIYQFNGEDLSDDSRVGLYVEDGYWEHRDAAVVFKHQDKWTGDVRYIYHGNDGTSMPWNDTAQLNFLLPAVREAVIQTILHVARKFPIIRFDAAMTLAKKHYQRLWFPQPGDGGAIPSRAEHSMTRPEYDEVFPVEFWREVVDRVTREVPETLLLAEAFWLMEGYFVRTLGMHRVYNSAFMNMLKMEENSKYRQTIKNVLEFSPAVLQRFVNFMNNPDERTAHEQFGRDDKYYGVAMLLVTMPGLPMFGHGQIEGFTEKYGMEYRRAYWDESVDEDMVCRHEAEIFPLMRKRHLFSGAENFALFDLTVPKGWVDENVFAFANRCDEERALIIYNNAYSTTAGCIHTSTAINEGDADNKCIVRRTLAEALGLNLNDNCYYVFQDHKTGLEYLRHAQTLARDGLHVQLQGYQYHAFIDFREVFDSDGSWGQLHASLAGAGVASIDEARQELIHAAVIQSFSVLINADMLSILIEPTDVEAQAEFEARLCAFVKAAVNVTGVGIDPESLTQDILGDLAVLAQYEVRLGEAALSRSIEQYLLAQIPDTDKGRLDFWRVPVTWAIMRRLYAAFPVADVPSDDASRLPASLFWKLVTQAFTDLGAEDWTARMETLLTKLLIRYPAIITAKDMPDRMASLDALFKDPDAALFLRINRYQGILWLGKEVLESFVYSLFLTSSLDLLGDSKPTRATLASRFLNVQGLLCAVEAASYQVEKILKLFRTGMMQA